MHCLLQEQGAQYHPWLFCPLVTDYSIWPIVISVIGLSRLPRNTWKDGKTWLILRKSSLQYRKVYLDILLPDWSSSAIIIQYNWANSKLVTLYLCFNISERNINILLTCMFMFFPRYGGFSFGDVDPQGIELMNAINNASNTVNFTAPEWKWFKDLFVTDVNKVPTWYIILTDLESKKYNFIDITFWGYFLLSVRYMEI